jgi:dihydrodipicolinate synthase/N-acetylneuraminate lyase
MIAIYDLFQSGEYDAALKEQHKLIDFLDALPKGARKDNFLTAAEEKYILSSRGICQEYTTSYYRDLTEAEKNSVTKALTTYEMIPSFEL